MGLLPVDARWAEPGKWHRDCEPLFRDGIDTPDFYFTVFVPLDRGGGATECILGSHRLTTEAAAALPYSIVECAPGDVVVMNGRLIHRGGANHSDSRRRLLYEVWAAPWFDEARN